MEAREMLRLFEAHREAEAARDIDAILDTFATDCFLETIPLEDGDLLTHGRGYGSTRDTGDRASDRALVRADVISRRD
jgi:hypothetical protein